MKTTGIVTFLVAFLLVSICGFSQTGYDMKSGETVTFDAKGNIISSTNLKQTTSKYNPDTPNKVSVEKNTKYNDDGTLKLPGYKPTGNQEVDEQNYKKAKYLFFQNNPEEYKKWVEKSNENVKTKIAITYEEFVKLPANKQKIILEQTDKYYIDMSTEYKDCE